MGWSIHNILLDITGGTLSLSQNLIDAVNCDPTNWGNITGNAPKVLLGCTTILMDIMFMTQHYVLYTKREPDASRVAGVVGDLDSSSPLFDPNKVGDSSESSKAADNDSSRSLPLLAGSRPVGYLAN